MFFINLENIKKIGPKRIEILNKMNINNIEDLLEYFPYKYQLLKETTLDTENVFLNVKVSSIPVVRYIKRNLNSLSFNVLYKDKIIKAIIFNRAFIKNNLTINRDIFIIGKYNNKTNTIVISDIRFYKIINPILEPKYHLINGMKEKTLKSLIENAINLKLPVKDYIPDYLNKKYNFIDKNKAISIIHYPNNNQELKMAMLKIIYEELFVFAFKINYLKYLKTKEETSLKRNNVTKDVNDFIKSLPFELTIDQQNSVYEIINNLNESKRMNRLLLGDVGSGKTIVAFISLYANFLSGYQGALMAPTEVLAMQHYKNIKNIFKNYNINIELLTRSISKGEKSNILKNIANKNIDIIVCTHSILSDNVSFNNLGLVITDEQHRFGVLQRKIFQNKGLHPDVLYLSATPIPRTYALTLYGDMDISTIKSKPKNRIPVKTYYKSEKNIKEVLEDVYNNLKQKHQIYVVSPAISNEEDNEINDVTKLKENFAKAFKNKVRIEILHSKIKQKEKDAIMHDFNENKINILISTTVIEVGIDNPNATLMIIFNAERFGLATLHQLRGRVGRGEFESKCYLISTKKTERISIMEKSNDGFYIAKKDYELRGEGDIFGERQSGDLSFKIADLKRDFKIFLQAKKDSEEFINEKKYENNHLYNDIIKEISFID